MSFDNLRDFIECLEANNKLTRIKELISPRHEMCAAMRYMDQTRGNVILFENVEGYDIPVIGNMLCRHEHLRTALGLTDEDLTDYYLKKTNQLIDPVVVDTGPVKEVIIDKEIDILKTMPVLTHHEKDIGPYFTCGISIAKDPDTGVRGVGLHRVQVKDRNRVGILLFSPPLGHFYKRYEERGEPMEIAIAVGLDPITFFSSLIWAPKGVDKFKVAGALMGKPLELVKCESVNLEVPAGAEFVLEGKLMPNIREKEGPFGESTGVYLSYENPVAEIDVITHRKKPIFQALAPLTNEGYVLVSFSWEAEKLKHIRKVFPQVKRAHMSAHEFGQIIVQIDKQSDEEVKNIIEFTFDLSPYNKSVIAVDMDIDVTDPKDVAWAVANRFQAHKDLYIQKNVPGSVIDPSAGTDKDFTTSKIGYDATKPFGMDERFEKIKVPQGTWDKVKKIVGGYL